MKKLIPALIVAILMAALNLAQAYYDPVAGRFLSFDPVNPSSGLDPSGYTFAGGDPINYFDPDGRFSKGFIAARNQEGYMPASATAAFMKGDYYGSWVRGAGQGLGQDVDNAWNFTITTLFYRSEAGTPEDFLQNYPLAYPMKNWLNINYGDNNAGNSFVTGIAPVTQNAINSLGVGRSITETPTFEVQHEPNFEPVPVTSINETYLPGQMMPNGQFAGVGPGAMFIGEPPSASPIKPNGNFYSVGYQMQLSPSSYPGILRPAHFQEANESLLQAMENDPQFAQMMQQGGINLQRTAMGLAPRTPPSGWTWHHAQEPGVMQLVPRVQHTSGSIFWDTLHPDGQGGYAIWGQQ
jgi:hypothetical protein